MTVGPPFRQEMATQEPPEYKGSCHCGMITYTARISFTEPARGEPCILSQCNCTYCQKAGLLIGQPSAASFKIVTPVQGEAALSTYTFNSGEVRHFFCPRCGITCHYTLPDVVDGKDVLIVRVNVLTIEGRVDGRPMERLRDVKIGHWDGRANGWDKGPGDEPWDGGVW